MKWFSTGYVRADKRARVRRHHSEQGTEAPFSPGQHPTVRLWEYRIYRPEEMDPDYVYTSLPDAGPFATAEEAMAACDEALAAEDAAR